MIVLLSMRSRLIVLLGALVLGAAALSGQQATPPPPPVVTPPVVTTPAKPTPQPTAPSRGFGTRPIGPTSPMTTAVIIGQVVDSTGRGIPKAAVRLVGETVIETVLTDPKGRFAFTKIPPGEAIVTAQKFGYVDGAYGKRRAGGQPLQFTLLTGQAYTDMRIEVYRSAVITGIVSDEAGDPLVGARVVAMRRKFVEGTWRYVMADSGTTDDQGAYRIFDLVPGEYVVLIPATNYSVPLDLLNNIGATGMSPGGGIAMLLMNGMPAAASGLAEERIAMLDQRARPTPDGRDLVWTSTPAPPDDDGRTGVYPTQYYPSAGFRTLALPINLEPGDVQYAVNFSLRLESVRSVAGKLVDENGRTANQLVRLVPIDSDDTEDEDAAVTVSAADGSFVFRRVPKGRYRLEAGNTAPIRATSVTEGVPADAPLVFWGRADVVVGDEDVDLKEIQMRPATTLEGQLYLDRPSPSKVPDPNVNKITISIDPASPGVQGGGLIHPEAGGEFAAMNLVPGRYFVRVAGVPPGWFVKSITAGSQDVMDEPMDVRDGGSPTINLTLTTASTQISGSVHDARTQPASGATVLVLPVTAKGVAVWTPNRTRETRASSNGVYTVSGLPPGDYLIVAIDDAMSENWQDPRVIATLRTLATRISLRDGEFKNVHLRTAPFKR